MRLRAALAVGLLAASLSACTKAQERAFIKKAGLTCQEDMPCWDCHLDGNRLCDPVCKDDEFWNRKDHECQDPRTFCRRTFGPDAVPREDRKTGDVGCYRIGTAGRT